MKKIVATESNYRDLFFEIGSIRNLANVILNCLLIYLIFGDTENNQEKGSTAYDASLAFNEMSQLLITNMMIFGLLLNNRYAPTKLVCTGLLSVPEVGAKKIETGNWWATLSGYGQDHGTSLKLQRYSDGAIMYYEKPGLDPSLTSLKERVSSLKQEKGVHILCLEGLAPTSGDVLIRLYNSEFLDIVQAAYICDHSQPSTKDIVSEEILQQQTIMTTLIEMDNNELKTPEIRQFENTMNWDSPTDLTHYLKMRQKVSSSLKKYEKKLRKSAEKIVGTQEKRDELPPTIQKRAQDDLGLTRNTPIHLHVFRGGEHFSERPDQFPKSPLVNKCDTISRLNDYGETVFEKVSRLIKMSRNSINEIEELLPSSTIRDEF